MKASKNDMQWLAPALQIVKDTDPAIYAKMQSDYWPVQVVDGPDDLMWILDKGGFFMWWQVVNDVPSAFGVTFRADDPYTPDWLKYVTLINRPAIEHYANSELHVPEPDFLADILVHEFDHRDTGHGEPLAFEASTRFGRKLPASDAPIVQLSEDTGNAIVRGEV